MKAVATEIDVGELPLADFSPYRIGCSIELRPNSQAGCRCGRRNEVDNDLMADQWFTAPVLADKGEQAVLDLVPLAGTWRKVAHGDRPAKLVCKLLKLHFPQPGPGAVATPAIRCDQ